MMQPDPNWAELSGDVRQKMRDEATVRISGGEGGETFRHMSTEWVAHRIRYLTPEDSDHAQVTTAARDRILRLELEKRALAERFAKACGEVASKQARIDELLHDVKEWLCEDCNTVYPGPPALGFDCLVCPKCNGMTGIRLRIEHRRIERLLDECRSHISAENFGLLQRIDAALGRADPPEKSPVILTESPRLDPRIRRLHDLYGQHPIVMEAARDWQEALHAIAKLHRTVAIWYTTYRYLIRHDMAVELSNILASHNPFQTQVLPESHPELKDEGANPLSLATAVLESDGPGPRPAVLVLFANREDMYAAADRLRSLCKQRVDNWPLPSFDAKDWAEAFHKRFPSVPIEDAISWFAPALMRGFDEHAWRQSATLQNSANTQKS